MSRPRLLSSPRVKLTVCPPATALISAGVPSATIRPPAITTIRSAFASASSRWCVANRTVRPLARMPRQNARRDSTSIALVGSSSTSTSESPAAATA